MFKVLHTSRKVALLDCSSVARAEEGVGEEILEIGATVVEGALVGELD
jgi:hypothetical protein